MGNGRVGKWSMGNGRVGDGRVGTSSCRVGMGRYQ